MDKYTCIIIEDEPLAMERTKSYAEKIPFLKLIGTFDNSMEGLSFLNSNAVDILFLDINMDELSGIELLENSKISCEVIITTAHQKYAIKGYELSVTDYLLKPYTFQRFLQAVNKAQENLVKNRPLKNQEFIFVKTENRLVKIMVSDIIFIEGMSDYRRIHTVNSKIMTLQNFTELEQMLAPNLVLRVHKSYMVALNKIEAIERGRIIIGKERIPISATYKTTFYQKIKRQ